MTVEAAPIKAALIKAAHITEPLAHTLAALVCVFNTYL